MRTHLAVIIVTIVGLATLAVAAAPSGAAPQGTASVAIVDNLRVFEDSNAGRATTQQIDANRATWQGQISTAETELQGLLTQRQQQAGVMTAEALGQLDADIEQKRIDLQRLRDDAQRQFNQVRDRILGDFEARLDPLVAQIAGERGVPVVFNSETPGLLYFDPAIDITDELIARLNVMAPTR
jgi:Skp family chaperone for outer membrane proteins